MYSIDCFKALLMPLYSAKFSINAQKEKKKSAKQKPTSREYK